MAASSPDLKTRSRVAAALVAVFADDFRLVGRLGVSEEKNRPRSPTIGFLSDEQSSVSFGEFRASKGFALGGAYRVHPVAKFGSDNQRLPICPRPAV